MVLSNSTKRVRHMSSLVNQNQGGGMKKAGFPYIIGRSASVSIAMNMTKPCLYGEDGCQSKSCATLHCLMTDVVFNVRQSRPIGVRPEIYDGGR